MKNPYDMFMSDDKLGRGSGSAGTTYCENCKKNTYNPRRKVCSNCRSRNARDGPLGF
tara:strand:- start:536 stop:706 length:171 start_codon:yes stop_codon:yes gene_type:complete